MRSKDYQGADLEKPCETIHLSTQLGSRVELLADQAGRYEQLRRNLVAPAFDRVVRLGYCLSVGDTRLAEPEMGNFVRQGEHLRGLGVRSVDKDEGVPMGPTERSREILRDRDDDVCCYRPRY